MLHLQIGLQSLVWAAQVVGLKLLPLFIFFPKFESNSKLLPLFIGDSMSGLQCSPEALIISFADASTAEGNRLASTLADALCDVDPSVVADRQRDRSDTQDFGASLAVVLGTAAATAVAKGIGAWLARNSGARIEIRRKGKVVLVASYLDSKDVPRIAKALSSEE